MNEKVINNLNKEYPNWYKKIRRMIVNLYRPILHGKTDSKWNQHLMFYIMMVLFLTSLVLLVCDVKYHYLPFLSGWLVIPITWIYLKIFPQTWSEMYEYEKMIFKQIWKLPTNWTPKN